VLTLALAALFGATAAPAAVLAWKHLREHVPSRLPFVIWLFRAFVLRHGPHSRPISRPRVYLVQRGAHHTPRGGTATITAEQLTAAPTPLELTA
jgi:hypothetical protein